MPALGQARKRLEAASRDPEPALRQLVRVFIDEGTFCPGSSSSRSGAEPCGF
uniref:Uncharacterized protein n=1 Tax=Arthrobacter sp. J3.37 TaxID=347208 RepID=I3W0V7_9MICC|nr:hypothetical protein [Arthrobacter sp. J3.37]